MPSVRIQLLGGASLAGVRDVPRLEKKSAALLAYLALEGRTSRSRVSGLLWPESKEATARNNLAQVVRRLKQAAGESIVAGDAAIELAGVEVDATRLLALVDEGSFTAAARLQGELLAGIDLDECADLEVWLGGARGRVRAAWSKAADAELARCEREGDLAGAAAWAARLVEVDPLSEAAHLRLARLHLERGDAAAAMAAYETCRRTLARELAIKPSAAMQELLRVIKEGPPRAPRLPGPQALPVSVLRPPWVGREAERAALSRASEARVLAIVEGEPGAGKSRLLRDLSAGRGAWVWIEGRPGDQDVPFATVARFVRVVARDRKVALPPWARAELARVVPELSDEEESGAVSVRSRIRFFEAVACAIELAAAGPRATLVLDDLQWIDAASAEVLGWVIDRILRAEEGPSVLVAHRAGELSGSEVSAMFEALEAAHPVARVSLGPLPDADVVALVEGLGLAFLEGRAAEIAAAARGVPLFALEIVRVLAAAGGGEGPLPIPDKVRALIQRRLARLGERALRLARLMSITGPELDLDLAAAVLQALALDLADPLAELERAQIVVAGRLSHDLLAEALRESLPEAVRRHLHVQVAEHLAKRRADPARVAQHFEAGGRAADAAPFLVEAATAARGMSRVREALSMYDRAARLFEAAGDLSSASRALYLRARSLMGDEADDVVARLERFARTDGERARALCTRANVALEAGRLDEARDVGKSAYPLAVSAGDALVAAESVQAWLDAELRAGRVQEAGEALEKFREASQAMSEDPEAEAAVIFYEAELLALAERHEQAIAKHLEALAFMERWGQMPHGRVGILSFLARSLVALGRVDEAGKRIEDARALLSGLVGAEQAEAHYRLCAAEVLRAQRDLRAIPPLLEPLAARYPEVRISLEARAKIAEARLDLGEHEGVRAELEAVASDPRADARIRRAAARARARAPEPARRGS